MGKTNIEWTHGEGFIGETWNPVAGCTWASPGCDHCYAATMTRRLEAMGQADYTGLITKKHFNGVVRTLAHKLDVPLRWKKPRMAFVNSMSDLFHPDVPFKFIDKVFAVMALRPQHKFQVLTKRPERMAKYLRECFVDGALPDEAVSPVKSFGDRISDHIAAHMGASPWKLREIWPLSNVWLGTSVENQEMADARIPHLLKCPAAVRFVSAEPLIENVDFSPWIAQLDWVIVGGESGRGARPFKVAWARSIISQCEAAGVPCFVKQMGANSDCRVSGAVHAAMGYSVCPKCDGERSDKLWDKKGGNWNEWPEDLRVREYPLITQSV